MRMFGQLIYWTLLIVCLGCQKTDDRLRVAVASNVQYAGEALVGAFKKDTGKECDLIVGSSGKLAAQIMSGAPFDVFLSADTAYINHLGREGFVRDSVRVYAYGQLVLWTLDRSIEPSIDHLLSDVVDHIALPNPDLAPYGAAAVQVLEKLGIFHEIEPKLVYGESIAQTNQFITTGAAKLGFTARSVVMAPNLIKVGRWSPVNPSLYPPLIQSAAVIRSNRAASDAEAFFAFLFSPTGTEILRQFGYTVPF